MMDLIILVCVLVARLCLTLCDPWTVAHQAPLSMEFSRQEYWSGLPCPPLGDLPNPGIEPMSPVSPALQADSLPLSHQGSHIIILMTQEKTDLEVMKQCGEKWAMGRNSGKLLVYGALLISCGLYEFHITV